MPNPIIEIAQEQKRELERRNVVLTNNLIGAYNSSLDRLDNAIELLNQEILNLTQNNQEISSSKLFRLSRYVSLQSQIVAEIRRYNNTANNLVVSEIPDIVTLSNNHSFILVRDQFQSLFGRRAITTAWYRLNQEQIEETISLLTNNSPFNLEYSRTLGETVADNIEQEIIQSVIIGRNPRDTARIIRNNLNTVLWRSLNTARTAQIYSYRTANHINYQNNSNIVKSWVWLSARDLRTCASCWAKHGTEYSINQILNDHHQGRCTALPQVKDGEKYGLENDFIERGEILFNQLPLSDQLSILGPTKLEMYRNREFQFIELSHDYENNIWGTMVRESTIRELRNDQ